MSNVTSSHVYFCDRDLARSASLRRRLRGRGMRVTATSAVRVLLERTRGATPDAVVLGDLSAQVDLETLAGLLRAGRRDLPIALMERPAAGAAADLGLAVPESATGADAWSALESWLDAPAAPRSRPLVLCVDDDLPFLDGLARLLRRQGYRVATFDVPEEALAAIPLKRPDLAILDVRMSGMSGFQMVEEIREVYGAALPILLLSGLDSDRSMAQGIKLGATAYLTKPCLPASVLSAVNSLTSGSERRMS